MSNLLMNERFVAVFPSLVRRLGSIEAAVILQHLHFKADESGAIKITMGQVSEDTGIGDRTVRRAIKWLRDEGYVTAERTSAWDSTLTYRIDHARLAVRSSADEQVEVAKVDTSQVAKVAVSSLQNVRTDVQTVGSPTTLEPAEEPERHPMRQITNDWAPSLGFHIALRQDYPNVDLPASLRRFIDHHIARGDTTRSWEALFRVWVSQDQDRYERDRVTGTDDLGNPLTQRKTSDTSRPLQPGDEGYVDPQELQEEARQMGLESQRRLREELDQRLRSVKKDES